MMPKLKCKLFKALAHPTRIKILELLEKENLCVCEICEALNKSQPNISQHLSKLKNADLVNSKKEGLQAYYTIKNKQSLNLLKLAEEIIITELENNKLLK